MDIIEQVFDVQVQIRAVPPDGHERRVTGLRLLTAAGRLDLASRG